AAGTESAAIAARRGAHRGATRGRRHPPASGFGAGHCALTGSSRSQSAAGAVDRGGRAVPARDRRTLTEVVGRPYVDGARVTDLRRIMIQPEDLHIEIAICRLGEIGHANIQSIGTNALVGRKHMEAAL